MKKKYQYRLLFCVILIMGLTACGAEAHSLQEAESEPVVVQEEPYTVVGLYQEQGMLRVNAVEQDHVRELGKLMHQNLELEEYLNDGISLITGDDWWETLMPGNSEDSRLYFLQEDGETVLVIHVGYDENAVAYSDVWYLGEETKMLHHSGDVVQLLCTQLLDGEYTGAFESWRCDGASGDIYHETGTFAEGVLTGEYTAAIHRGMAESDVYALWCNRQTMNYSTYTGHFDENGRTTLEQPAAERTADWLQATGFDTCIVYAYDRDNASNCLYRGISATEEELSPIFRIEDMGWKGMPGIVPGVVGMNRMEGAILPEEPDVAEPAAPAPSSKPAKKPAPVPEVSPVPETTPVPEPSPVPSPAPQPVPPTPTPESPPSPAPEPDVSPDAPAGGESGDVDVEWTPDIL